MDYMGTWGNKDPDEKKEYALDWSPDIRDGDSIQTSTWTVREGSVTLVAPGASATLTKITVDGGTDGEICYIHNHCVTVLGEKLDGTMRLDIRTR